MNNNVSGFKLYLTRRTQRAQSYYLTVDAGAGGVAVARDGGRRDDERKTENVDSLMFNDNGPQTALA